MRRVAVVGNAGSGKSTLAAALAGRLGVPRVELDAIYHLAGWRELPADEFRARVSAVTDADAWVVDGNYTAVRDLVWSRADTVVWIDLPRGVVMRRIAWRTLSRGVIRRVLWNGNRESLRNALSRDPERSIIAWSWAKHSEYRALYATARDDVRWAHLTFVRLTSPRAVRRFLATAA